MYADDTAVLARSRIVRQVAGLLQDAASELEDWYSRWRLAVNPEKSAAVFFTRRRQAPDRDIVMFGRPIPWETQVRYLGLILDSKLTWRKHIDHRSGQAAAAIAKLYPLLARNSKLHTDNKLLLYKTVIRPSMTYASQVWAYAAHSHINKIQIVQNKVLRMIVDAPWFVTNRRIHEDLLMPTIMEFLQQSAASFAQALADNPNTEVNSLWGYDVGDVRRHKRPKLILQPT